jgi:fructose-1,6-bisphosphatase/inositol monophosphatase family enzyme
MNVDRLAAILKQAAQEEIMPRFRRLDEGTVKTKTGAFDLVTAADVGAERVITAAIKAHRPDALVIGEEAVSDNPRLLDADLADRVVIYVDPVDGTANFAGGLPLFAVMAAVVQNGEPVAGVIYDPVGDDVLMAERGCGAFQVFPDGRTIRQKYADPVPLAEMGGLASTAFLPMEQRRTVLTNLAKVKMLASYRCAGHEYRYAAGGNIHFLMYSKLMPWDHVGGALIMRECGAFVAKFDGSPYHPSDVSGGLLVAPDRESWDELKREVFAV